MRIIRIFSAFLIATLVLSGCYASLGGTVSVPLSDTSVGTTGSPEVELGLLADFGDSQVFASSRVGGLIIGPRLRHRVTEDRSRPLVGGVVGFMFEQEPVLGSSRSGMDWRVALLYTPLPAQNSDLEKSGTLVSIMVGPSFKGGKQYDKRPEMRLQGGLAPGIVISRLDLDEEITWSIGFSFKLMLWQDTTDWDNDD